LILDKEPSSALAGAWEIRVTVSAGGAKMRLAKALTAISSIFAIARMQG
jgi:hypothetical protein